MTSLNPLPPVPDAISEYVTTDGNVVYVSDLKHDAPVYQHWRSKARLYGNTPVEKIIPATEFNQRFRRTDGVSVSEQTTEVQKAMIDLITQAATFQSSDIHIALTKHHAEVEFRINGDLETRRAIEASQAIAIMSSTMNTLISDGAKGNKPFQIQTARISHPGFLPESVSNVRVTATPMAHSGRLMSLRLLYKDTGNVQGTQLERLIALGFDPAQAADMQAILRKPQGVLIIAGTTGAGKSTTVFHALVTEKIERPGRNVVSVEDPAEYEMTDKGIKQLSVSDTATEEERRQAFQNQLNLGMRLDPELLNVGEVRDRVTMNTVVEFALSGHNVITSFHASSPLGILKRAEIILKNADMPDPLKVLADAQVTAGLAYQKLTKRLCPHCATKGIKHLDNDEGHRLLERLCYVHGESVEPGKLRFINPDGCDQCSYTGVGGRTMLSEVVKTDSILFELLLNQGYEAAYRYWRDDLNGLTLQAHAAKKVVAGEIDMLATESLIGPLDELLLLEERRDAYFKREEEQGEPV